MVNVLFELCPKQFTERTLSVPLLVNREEKLTVTVEVPCPLVMVAFVGAVHV